MRRFAALEQSVTAMVPDSRSRLAGHGPLSVIDIGSNSVRLVTYERLSRSPAPIFNEKALCGLGSGLGETGRLNDKAVDDAMAVIRRFKAISDQLGSVQLLVLATAAAREATNGDTFIKKVEAVCGTEPLLLSGADEARYSGYGILSGFYKPDGIMGDMGGGSLEIADIANNKVGEGATYPLGGLRLQDMSGKSALKAMQIAEQLLAKSPILAAGKERPFYAIGGTWRSLAYLHMRQNNYPLRVLHHYEVPAKKMASFCEQVVKTELGQIRQIEVVSKNRAQLLPYGAAVLLKVIEEMKPASVIISALGVREGLLYEQLSAEQCQEDGLLAGAEDLSLLRSRSPMNTFELIEWTATLFSSAGLVERDDQARLRKAACLLSDLGWRAHPDYRGEQCLNTIAHAAFISIDHPGRAFIALSAYLRHEGPQDSAALPALTALLDNPDMRLRAHLLGLAFRIAHLICASMSGTLLKTHFSREGDTLFLNMDKSLAAHLGERLNRRMMQMKKLIDIKTEIRLR